MTIYTRRSLLLIFILSTVALGIALFSQHVAGMRPCAWCVFQRLIVLVIGVIALAGLMLGNGRRRLTRTVLFITTGLGLGGILAAWYQYSVAAMQFSCDQTFADRFMTGTGLDGSVPWLFGIYATCMDARVDLLGVEYALWSLGLFITIVAVSLIGLLFTRRKR